MYKYEVFGEDHVDDVLSKVTEWEIYLDINICIVLYSLVSSLYLTVNTF